MKLRYRMMAVAIIGIAWLACGCSASTKARFVVDSMDPMIQNLNKAYNKCNDVELARKAMPASLLQLTSFVEVSPENPNLLLSAAEAYGSYARFFLADTDQARAARFFRKSRDYALRVLKQHAEFAKAFGESAESVESNAKYNAALKTLTVNEAPALYFASSNWFFYINIVYARDKAVLKDFDKVLAMLNRMVELDENFRSGAVHAVLGCYYASLPDTMGGNPDASLKHFKKAMDIAESKILLWRLYYAKYYAVQVQDRALFLKTLDDIIAAPEDLLPEKMLMNQVAKVRAKKLLQDVDNLFKTIS